MSLYQDVIIAGFGGQGVMLIGNLFAYAGMNAGLNATYIPVYGPEMRGGTANCTVVISDEDIGSPIIKTPQTLILMNQPSADKFLPRMEKNGFAVLNTSLVNMPQDSGGAKLLGVAANEIADGLGNVKMANMVALGSYVQASGVFPLSAVAESLKDVISAHYSKLIPKNIEALEAGAAAARDAGFKL